MKPLLFDMPYPSYLDMRYDRFPPALKPKDIENEYKVAIEYVEHTRYEDEIHWSELG